MSIDAWLAAAMADADRIGLPELKPLLDGLAQSTRALRAADWNDTGDGGQRAETKDDDRPQALSREP
jgi:hypothetical protein